MLVIENLGRTVRRVKLGLREVASRRAVVAVYGIQKGDQLKSVDPHIRLYVSQESHHSRFNS